MVLVHGEGLRSDHVPEDCFVDTLTSEQQNAIWRGVLFEDPSAMIRNPPIDADFVMLNRLAVERVYQCWPLGPYQQWCQGDFTVFSQGSPS